jgi:hypothetical protein
LDWSIVNDVDKRVVRLETIVEMANGSRRIKFAFLSVKAPARQGAKAPRKDNGIFDSNIGIFQAFATQPGRMNWPLNM